ncbi:MAG: radical SAM family heme chaperone HemW [Clostridia bacterium]|nr:radical SAM family heme chaperone HemW [Clostridia bacterium]
MELYVHIPFCIKKCAYCDFASYPGRSDAFPGYIDALMQEADTRIRELGSIAPETLYIGGGTPSILPLPLMEKLLEGLALRFPMHGCLERTMEVNPGTVTPDFLRMIRDGGINRISMGMQAKQAHLLSMLGRIHDWDTVKRTADAIHEIGFLHLNLDLMFGLPGQTREDWRETLQAALSLSPDHLSCYGLIPEEGTPLKTALDKGTLALPDEETERAMYDDALTLLSEAGFAQYEISNFARSGCLCRHNLGYWCQIPYLGLGCSAASMLPGDGVECIYYRETNPSDLDAYLQMMREKAFQKRDVDRIGPRDAMFETMMLGLRMTHGVSESYFYHMHGTSLASVFGEVLCEEEKRGLVTHKDGWWYLTRRGMDIQNTVLVDLMESMEKWNAGPSGQQK